jgi:uncharacterized repeat protein (TIGR03803 family)
MSKNHVATCAGLAAAIAVGSTPAQAAAGFKTIYNFTGGADSLQPSGNLVIQGGKIYGSALGSYAMAHFTCKSPDCGTVFSFDPATKTLKTLHDFSENAVGYFPGAGLVAEHGALYGIAWLGGSGGYGAMFSFDPATGAEKTVYNMSQYDVSLGFLQPVAYRGALYGTTSSGTAPGNGNQNGTLYKIDPATGKETLVYAFQGWDGGRKDGWYPIGIPLFVRGQIYGNTIYGGQSNNGTLYTVDPATGAEKVLYSFTGGKDGKWPSRNLVYDKGVLYGTTILGAIGYGTVFKFDLASGRLTTLHAFTGGAEGGDPSNLVMAKGEIYVATSWGGGQDWGTIAQVDPGRGKTLLVHSFQGESDGILPGAMMVSGGKIYGSTGTVYPFVWQGTLFEITP